MSDYKKLSEIKEHIETLAESHSGSGLGVNLKQINGTTVASNSGVLSAGVIRTAVASNDVNLGKLQYCYNTIVPDLAECLRIGVQQMNGVTVSTEAGLEDPGTQRVCIATDDVNLAEMNQNLREHQELVLESSSASSVNFGANIRAIANSSIAANSGVLSNGVLRVCIATDDINSEAINTATSNLQTSNAGSGLAINLKNINGNVLASGAGIVGSGVQRFVSSTDDVNFEAMRISLGNIETSLDNIEAILTDVWDSVNNYLRVHETP